MRKSLVTLAASLLLCVGATAAVIAADNSAPVKLAMVSPPAMRIRTQAPPPEGAGFHGPDGGGPMTGFCEDRYARTAGELAYLEASLQLNAQQSSSFARWRTVRLDAAKAQSAACENGPAARRTGNNAQSRSTPPSPVERMTREETMLKQRLADLQAERPALEAVYNSLTPQQRQRFLLRGMAMRGPQRGMMRDGVERGPMGHGPMERGPMERGPMGGPNPPPPPLQP